MDALPITRPRRMSPAHPYARLSLGGAIFALAAALFLASAAPVAHGASPISVVATTGMIADAARNVAGPHADVIGLMGPGVDPHLYRASQGDVRRLASADLILYNGLGLEGRMADVLIQMARTKPTVAVTEYIPEERLNEPEAFGGHYDPHVWFDVTLWIEAVKRIRDALMEVDPAHRADYEARAESYIAELLELHQYVKDRIAEIPPESRVLITAHDAFGYFGLAYGIEVVGLQGISTDTEVGLRDRQELVQFIVRRKIKAVFVESSVPRKSIEAVVEDARRLGHTVSIGGELFSDALGAANTPAGTYIGMIRHNVDTIVAALK